MAESAATLPADPDEPPVVGRSLWADARARLVRNRAALTSMIVLGVIALACVFGPFFTGHPFDRVYPDYVRVPGEPVRLSDRGDRSRRRSSASRARVRAKAEAIDDRRRHPAPRRSSAPRAGRSTSGCSPISSARICSAQPGRRREAERRPAPRRRGADRAPAFPVRHRRQRPRPPHPHHEGRADLARHRPARDLRRDRHRRASTARPRAISAAASTSS